MQYMQECVQPGNPEPPLTNGKLAALLQDTRTILALCNADKASLRSWASKLK